MIRFNAKHAWVFKPGVSIMLCMSFLVNGCQTLQLYDSSSSILEVWHSKPADFNHHEFHIYPEQKLIGTLAQLKSKENDTLSDIARHYGLGYNSITLANSELDPWNLHNHDPVLLPLSFIMPDAPRHGIVLNLATLRLFYFPKNQPDLLLTYPVGIGREGWNTPLGDTEIVAKKANPEWTVPSSIQKEHEALGDPLPKIIQSGPDNPLGNFALPLSFKGYLIHGTNKPYGIGMQISHGCVQLYPEDIENLFKNVQVGTPVKIVHQPYLAAWEGNMLFLEAHPPLEQWRNQTRQLQKALRASLSKLAAEKQAVIDWKRVDRILSESKGIPTPVLVGGQDLADLIANAEFVQHPYEFFGQPSVNELTDNDWSIITNSWFSESEAQKLAAMLNHQGPPIPARMISKNGEYQVVAGPFKDRKTTIKTAKRIKQNFDLEVTALEPKEQQAN
jgi:L,D-transpeptidase ErfK/SrfK